MKEGPYLRHYQDTKQEEGAFRGNERHGTWSRFDRAGALRETGRYERGRRVGRFTGYHRQGNGNGHGHGHGRLWWQAHYDEDERALSWTYWDRDGNVVESSDAPHEDVQAAHASRTTAALAAAVYPGDGLRSLSGVRWALPTHCAFSTAPLVTASHAFFSCRERSFAGEPSRTRVYALLAASGRLLWREELGERKPSPLALDGDTLYLVVGETLLALDAHSGERLWGLDLPGGANAFSPPLVHEGNLFVGAGKTGIHAVGVEERSVRWTFNDVPSWVNAPLVAVADAGRPRIVARFWNARGLIGLDAATGERVWELAVEGSSRGPAAVADDVVYFGSRDHRLYALDAPSGDVKWTFETDGFVHAGPATSPESVFVASGDGIVYALDRRTGTEQWRFVTRAAVEHDLSRHGDVLLARSRDGHLYALDTVRGELLWSFDTGSPWGSPPAAWGELVLLGANDGFLYALE